LEGSICGPPYRPTARAAALPAAVTGMHARLGGAGMPAQSAAVPRPSRCSATELDGLCSLRLRAPCMWAGALYDAVGPVESLPVKSGACDFCAGQAAAVLRQLSPSLQATRCLLHCWHAGCFLRDTGAQSQPSY
jgi:hypothetical protein